MLLPPPENREYQSVLAFLIASLLIMVGLIFARLINA